jgi:hypothetical protein
VKIGVGSLFLRSKTRSDPEFANAVSTELHEGRGFFRAFFAPATLLTRRVIIWPERGL